MAITHARHSAGRWSDFNIPHHGWTCVDIEDLDEPAEVCEMCGRAEIRFVHCMEHPDSSETLRVGCICAGKLEGNPQRAANREREAESRGRRRASWLTRRWLLSGKGNERLNIGGFYVTVFQRAGRWSWSLNDHNTSPPMPTTFSSQRFSTSEAAKLAAFDAFWGRTHPELLN